MAKNKIAKKQSAQEIINQNRLMSHFVWAVRRLMAEQSITKYDLSLILEKPMVWVTKFLDGALPDIDIRVMSDIMTALSKSLKVELTQPKDNQ